VSKKNASVDFAHGVFGLGGIWAMIETVKEAADLLQVTEATVRRWIRSGHIDAAKPDNQYRIINNEKTNAFLVSRIRDLSKSPPKAWNPKEIKDYSKWHDLLDEMTWLLKVCYSSPKAIKRKKFRLDSLFAEYLRTSNITLKNVRAAFRSRTEMPRALIVADLKRGWYNELAYAMPLRASTIGLSFSDIACNKSIANVRFAFPSWRVTTAYYAAYFYLRAITLQNQNGFRLEQHGATISCFKNGTVNAIGGTLWRFPFDIAYVPGQRMFRRSTMAVSLPHARHQYSQHPRAPHRSPLEILDNIYSTFKKRGQGRGKTDKHTLFDFLHDFRVWANYQDIDNLLSLWGEGYKAFLDSNLSTLLFFIGGMSELAFICVFGFDEYQSELQHFYDLFAANNSEIERSFSGTPPYQRLQVFNQMELVVGDIALKPQEDINQISVVRTGT
jgi:excisionase family DNA binding protein